MTPVKTLILCLVALFPMTAKAFDHRPGLQYSKAMFGGTDQNRAQVVDEALDAVIREAQRQLWKAGSPDLAEQLRFEWEGTYKGYLERTYDEGDHAPLSQWLAIWYMALDASLGQRVMEMTHLVDIKTFNFAIPVAFNPHAQSLWCHEQMIDHPTDTCEAEYRRHMAGTKYTPADPFAEDPRHHGLCGVTTYWVVFSGCEAALWGLDWSLICGIAGDTGEVLMDKIAAPKISDKIWLRHNPASALVPGAHSDERN